MEKITINITGGNLYKIIPLFIEYIEAKGKFVPKEKAEEFDAIIGSRVLAMKLEENSKLLFQKVVVTRLKKDITFNQALEAILIDAGTRDSWYDSVVPGGKDYS